MWEEASNCRPKPGFSHPNLGQTGSMFVVFVRGLEFYAFHGVPEAERQVGHRYRVDIELRVEGSADETDDVADTVDYGKIAQRVTQLGTAERCRTVERLARKIGEALLDENPALVSIWISVAKPLPPAPVIAEEAGCELELTRA